MFDHLLVSSPALLRSRLAPTVPLAVTLHAGVVVLLLILPLWLSDPLPWRPDGWIIVKPVAPGPPPPRFGREKLKPAPAPFHPQPGAWFAPAVVPEQIPPDFGPSQADLPVWNNDPPGGGGGAMPGAPLAGTLPVNPLPGSDYMPGQERFNFPVAPVSPPPRKPVELQSEVLLSRLIHKVVPVYPLTARLARIQGKVLLRVAVDEMGHVAEVIVVSGHELLAPAAVAAVRQWMYTPTLVNGVPCAVIGTVTVNFVLG